MNLTIQQLSDLFCHGNVPDMFHQQDLSANGSNLSPRHLSSPAWSEVKVSSQINGFYQGLFRAQWCTRNRSSVDGNILRELTGTSQT